MCACRQLEDERRREVKARPGFSHLITQSTHRGTLGTGRESPPRTAALTGFAPFASSCSEYLQGCSEYSQGCSEYS
jgi:hypothetical protein